MGSGNPQGAMPAGQMTQQFRPPQMPGYGGPSTSGADLGMQTRMNMLGSQYQPIDRSGWQAYTPNAVPAGTPGSMMQATVPQAPQQAAVQAQTAPAMTDPMRHQWRRQGGLMGGNQGSMAPGALQSFLGLDPGFGGGIDPTTGQYVAPSQTMSDQFMLRQNMNRTSPYSTFYNDPRGAALWRSSIMQRPETDPLRMAMYGNTPFSWPSLRT